MKILNEHFKLKEQFPDNYADASFWQKVYRGAQKVKVESSSVCCFSLRNDIVLMWSHYGCKHSGVCIEFDNMTDRKFIVLKDVDFTEGVVNYRSEERINYVQEDRISAVLKLFLNKSRSWEHEQEYRFILLNHKQEIQYIHTDFVKGVYFGLRVADIQIREFIESINWASYLNVKFYRAVRDGFNLLFLPL